MGQVHDARQFFQVGRIETSAGHSPYVQWLDRRARVFARRC